MKKNVITFCFLTFLSIATFSACDNNTSETKEFTNIVNSKDKANNVYNYLHSFAETNNDLYIDSIKSSIKEYLKSNETNTRRLHENKKSGKQVLDSFFNAHSVPNADEFKVEFIVTHPLEFEKLIQENTSQNVFLYYKEIINNSIPYNILLSKLYSDKSISPSERIGLIMMSSIFSQYNESIATRGFWDDVKCRGRRVGKLAMIVGEVMVDLAYNGVDDAVDNAVENLKGMGDKYNCT